MPSLVFAATDTAFCHTFISLKLEESRILHAAPTVILPRTPHISFCTVQLKTLCIARSLATLCFSTASDPGPEQLPGFWGSMVFHHVLIPRKDLSNNKYFNYIALIISCIIFFKCYKLKSITRRLKALPI